MKTRSYTQAVKLLIGAGLFALLAVAGTASQAGPQAVPQARYPDDLLAEPKKKEPERAREEVLADLFDRLQKAPDAETAELVAEAIEKIWLRSGSDTVDLLMNRAMVLVQQEDLDLALDILDSIVEIAPDYPEGWNRRATVLFMKRDYRRSLDDLRHVLSLEPRHFKAINGLALIMQELGDKKSALRAFREMLKVYPQDSSARRVEQELAREVEGQGI